MLIFVKNMVCDRCIASVRQQLSSLHFDVNKIALGRVEVSPDPTIDQLQDISSALRILGFEVLDKQKDQLIDQVKTQIIESVHYSDLSTLKESMLVMIADKLHRDYVYLSRLFSDSEGITIERYIIHQKIEKVKELLEYGTMSLKEISYKMGYSSSAHLSTQFKLITGLSPSKFISSGLLKRKPLDQLE